MHVKIFVIFRCGAFSTASTWPVEQGQPVQLSSNSNKIVWNSQYCWFNTEWLRASKWIC